MNNTFGIARHFSASTDAAPTAELSENEKKLSSEIENLNKDIAKIKEKCEDLDVSWLSCIICSSKVSAIIMHAFYIFLQDKYKRSLADTENMRKRLTKQIEDAKLFGIQGFCKDLLTVSDILQKATESVPPDQVNSNPHLKNLYEGLTMTEAELQKVCILTHNRRCTVMKVTLKIFL